jgi:hypothetical protein
MVALWAEDYGLGRIATSQAVLLLLAVKQLELAIRPDQTLLSQSGGVASLLWQLQDQLQDQLHL